MSGREKFTRMQAARDLTDAYNHGRKLGVAFDTDRPRISAMAWIGPDWDWVAKCNMEAIRGFDEGRADRDAEIKAVIHGSPWPAPDGTMTPSVTPDPGPDFGGAA